MKLGKNIKAIRKIKGMSVRTIQRLTGYNYQALYHIEREERGISITKLIAFAKALGCTMEEVVSGTINHPKEEISNEKQV